MVSNTGASAHVTGSPSKYTNLKPYKGNDGIMVGNGEILPITHIGETKINTDSSSIPLKNILRVPNIKKDLLSVTQLTTAFPYTLEFSSICMIKDRTTGRIVATGSRRGDLYALNGTQAAYFSNRFRRTTAERWHQRLGHPHPKIVQYLLQNKFINSFSFSF